MSQDTAQSYAAALRRNVELEKEIAEAPERFRILTGDRPTGRLHVGHYFGTLENRVRLQNEGVHLFVLVADYQVLTDRDVSTGIAGNVFQMMLDYLAVGIDPSRSVIFAHSQVPELNQLLLPFLSLVSLGELQRNPTVKDEIRLSKQPNVSGLMFTYPVHQAADILFMHGNLVPVGKDQLPHLELTRDIARRFNERYTPDKPYFPAPEALLSRAPLLLGVDGAKMGKSANNAIAIGATEDETAKLIRGAKTDAERTITYDPEGRPEVANLLLLASLCVDEDPAALAEKIGDGGGAALKATVTDAVNDYFRPVRARRAELAQDPAAVLQVLRQGNAAARELAATTLDEVTGLMGMRY